jgi:rod shape determining protein RodA
MENKGLFKNIDWTILLLVTSLIAIGLINIYSAEYSEANTKWFDIKTNFTKQMIFLLFSFVLFIGILVIDVRFFINFSYPIYGFTILALLVTLVLGKEVSGSKSWIAIGIFNVQTSEFAKFGTAMALAKYLDGYNINISRTRDSIFAFLIVLVPMGLTLLQNDYGSGLVFCAFILVLFRQGLNPIYLYLPTVFIVLFFGVLLFSITWVVVVLVVIAAIAFLLLYSKKNSLLIIIPALMISLIFVFSTNYVFDHVLESHQRTRINVLLGKEIDLKGSGYNVHQSLIAVGSGGGMGKGFLKGTQTKFNFVPEQSTDFIFCTVAEEYGFVGSVILILLYTGLLARILYVSEKQKLRYSRVYGYSLMSLLFFHFAVNLSMTTGLFPVIGIPLPLISYGGSSLLSFVIMFAIFLKLDSDFKYYYT